MADKKQVCEDSCDRCVVVQNNSRVMIRRHVSTYNVVDVARWVLTRITERVPSDTAATREREVSQSIKPRWAAILSWTS